MRVDGLPKLFGAFMILILVIISANTRVTRLHPTAHVYQIQMLGSIMLVCPETFTNPGDEVDCDRWVRRSRGGTTVFVQPSLVPTDEQLIAQLEDSQLLEAADAENLPSLPKLGDFIEFSEFPQLPQFLKINTADGIQEVETISYSELPVPPTRPRERPKF